MPRGGFLELVSRVVEGDDAKLPTSVSPLLRAAAFVIEAGSHARDVCMVNAEYAQPM